jgi:hypothetical protein
MADNRWFILLFIVCFFAFVVCIAWIAKIIILRKYRSRGIIASETISNNDIEVV